MYIIIDKYIMLLLFENLNTFIHFQSLDKMHWIRKEVLQLVSFY